VTLRDPVVRRVSRTGGTGKEKSYPVIRIWLGLGKIKERTDLLVVQGKKGQPTLQLGKNFAPGLWRLESGAHNLVPAPKGLQP